MSTIKVNKIENASTADGGIDIDSSGKVGIGGVSSPSAPFHLNAGTTNNALFIDSSDAEVSIGLAASDGAVRLLQSSGGLVIRANGNANAFGTGDSERARFLAAGGLTFNGDTAAANALDDYEEGTYTPTTQNITTTGTATLTGEYVKIGKQVTVGILFACTGTIAYSVSAQVTLPFAPAYGAVNKGLIDMLVNNNQTAFDTNKSGTQCKIDGEGTARFLVGSFTTTSTGEGLIFGGTYIAAS